MEPLFPPVDWQIQWDTLQLTPFQRDHSGLSRTMGHVFNGREYRYLLPYWFFPCSAVAGLAVVKSALVGLCTSVFY